MSKRHRGRDSSLELLLDTICNTFGGVLFVAILIVVLLRMTSTTEADTDVTQVSEAEQLQLEQQHAELQGTLETLRQVATVRDSTDEAADSATSKLLGEFENKQEARQQLLQQRLSILNTIADHQTRINAIARDIAEMEERARGLAERKDDLEAALKKETAKRSQKAEYSRLGWSGKQEVQAVVRFGRLYIVHRYGASGLRLGLNTDDFIVVGQSATHVRATPMPQAGTPISETSTSDQQLTARLSRFDPSRDYIGVVVWPDSFEHFRHLKKAFVQRGFEYRLIPAKDGDKFLDRGGTSEGVQ